MKMKLCSSLEPQVCFGLRLNSRHVKKGQKTCLVKQFVSVFSRCISHVFPTLEKSFNKSKASQRTHAHKHTHSLWCPEIFLKFPMNKNPCVGDSSSFWHITGGWTCLYVTQVDQNQSHWEECESPSQRVHSEMCFGKLFQCFIIRSKCAAHDLKSEAK